MRAETAAPAGDVSGARGARADARVAQELYRTALAGDRRVVVITLLAALFVTSLVEQQTTSRAALFWCSACVALAAARWFFNRTPRAQETPAAAKAHRQRWLVLLFVASALWGAGPPLFLIDNPSADTSLTGIFLAAAGLSASLLAAWRPAVYVALLPALVPLLITLAWRPLVGAVQAGAVQAGVVQAGVVQAGAVHAGVVQAGAVHASAYSFLLAALAAGFLLVLERLTMAQNDSLALLLAVRFRNEDLVRQLRSQVEVADRAVQDKTRFLASAAHDLRQPMHALGMFCATLQMRLKNSPEKPLVRNIMNAIESLEESFSAMLDISRLDAGVVESTPQTFPIRDLFRRLYQQFGGDAEERELALRFRASQRVVRSDPLLLERVLANLVQNALRYTHQGGVLVAARRHPLGVGLEVWDTGLGIPPDKMDMIFREFYQIENPERDRGRGLGMGLAIVRRLCNLLEHPLEVRSRPGRGSVFCVVVPAGDADAIDAASLEADTLPPRKEGVVTVLLIDDEAAIREATQELLRPMDVDVIVAGSIDEAVELAKDAAESIDLILSDWRLRGQETGIEAIRAVRAVCGESTPAILVTGDTSSELLKLAHDGGLVVLHKPLQPRQVVRLIKHLRR